MVLSNAPLRADRLIVWEKSPFMSKGIQIPWLNEMDETNTRGRIDIQIKTWSWKNSIHFYNRPRSKLSTNKHPPRTFHATCSLLQLFPSLPKPHGRCDGLAEEYRLSAALNQLHTSGNLQDHSNLDSPESASQQNPFLKEYPPIILTLWVFASQY